MDLLDVFGKRKTIVYSTDRGGCGRERSVRVGLKRAKNAFKKRNFTFGAYREIEHFPDGLIIELY